MGIESMTFLFCSVLEKFEKIFVNSLKYFFEKCKIIHIRRI
jgi:hypothetical protein